MPENLHKFSKAKAPVTMPLIILVAEASDRILAGFLEIDLRSHADGCNPSCPVGYGFADYSGPVAGNRKFLGTSGTWVERTYKIMI
jgi:hypothetical protein